MHATTNASLSFESGRLLTERYIVKEKNYENMVYRESNLEFVELMKNTLSILRFKSWSYIV